MVFWLLLMMVVEGRCTVPLPPRQNMNHSVNRFRDQYPPSFADLNPPLPNKSTNCNTPGAPLWQRNYYEHIVRNEKSLNRIRQYIINNPANWENDIENVEIKTRIDRRKYFDLIIGKINEEMP